MMYRFLLFIISIIAYTSVVAQNPFVTHIYTADPTARVFNGKLYVYPSHDVDTCTGGQGDNGFCMPDYHMFSTDDHLYNWTDHGTIVSQNTVPWVEANSFGMWAPDCVFKDGTYYFYFPAKPANENIFRRIGVATSTSPTGPFTPLTQPIQGIQGIDPNVFIDDDGKSYLYFGSGSTAGALKVIRLKDNMTEIDGNTITVDQDVPNGYREGSFMFKRENTYYFTFARVTSNNYEIEYATSNSPTGPFTYRGAIMQNIGNGTNHHSVVFYNNQWYLFYHNWSLSGNNRLRSIRADKLFFNPNGTIQLVTPTLRGIGIPKAEDIIHIDRYSSISNAQVHSVQGSEPKGFQVDFIENNSWVKFDDVDFEAGNLIQIHARVASATNGGSIEIRTDSSTGPLLATIPVSNTGGWDTWETVSADFTDSTTGIKDLVCVFKGGSGYLFNVNWIQFESGSTLSVTSNEPDNSIKIYPNPVKDVLHIIKGAVLLETTVDNIKNNMDISTLPNGIYFVQTKNTKHSYKLIKM